ncbi:MAG TPA: hypothetical protein VD794_15985 [Flavisolibacter sp.]|nr:hypothetical protein [Flavisolibacter sp.]
MQIRNKNTYYAARYIGLSGVDPIYFGADATFRKLTEGRIKVINGQLWIKGRQGVEEVLLNHWIVAHEEDPLFTINENTIYESYETIKTEKVPPSKLPQLLQSQ